MKTRTVFCLSTSWGIILREIVRRKWSAQSVMVHHHKAVCAKLCNSLEKPSDKGEGKEKKEGDKEANTDTGMHVTMGTQVFCTNCTSDGDRSRIGEQR